MKSQARLVEQNETLLRERFYVDGLSESGLRWKSHSIGVSWNKPMAKWSSKFERDGIEKHIGYFDDPVDAAIAYNDHSIKWASDHGETPRFLNPV